MNSQEIKIRCTERILKFIRRDMKPTPGQPRRCMTDVVREIVYTHYSLTPPKGGRGKKLEE